MSRIGRYAGLLFVIGMSGATGVVLTLAVVGETTP